MAEQLYVEFDIASIYERVGELRSWLHYRTARFQVNGNPQGSIRNHDARSVAAMLRHGEHLFTEGRMSRGYASAQLRYARWRLG